MISQLLKLPRIYKQLILIALDSILLVFVFLASFTIRLGYLYLPKDELLWVVLLSPIIAVPIFLHFGLYRSILRYIGIEAIWSIVYAVTIYALLWGLLTFMMSIEGIPRSIIIINWAMTLLVVIGIRISATTILNGKLSFIKSTNQDKNTDKKQIIIYGAGKAGIQLADGLEHSSKYIPVAFIDDAIELQGNKIRGLVIYPPNQAYSLIKEHNISLIFIALPSASHSKRLSLINTLEKLPVEVKLLPTVAELADGKLSANDLREVSTDELLGRYRVKPNKELLCKNITQKNILVTGAGGSIGSEMCRQILLLNPKIIVLYERSELALYEIEKELSERVNIRSTKIYPILGSITNNQRFRKTINHFKVDTIYHTAAYKHVPMVELNNTEGVRNNIFGTLICAQAAIDLGVETFVLISTDKAVRPTNTMGATKRSAELILQAFANNINRTKFTMVRFGNVLGSSGSVIPLFREQIKNGGPVTVTDKNVNRFFMTISEAVELVIQAGAMGTGGDVFVLDMGKPVLISDLAEKMIRLSGLEVKNEFNPSGDIEIIYTKLRPGEKLYEELLIGNNVTSTSNPLIMRAQEHMVPWDRLNQILSQLEIEVEKDNQKEIRRLLLELVPEFNPNTDISDILYDRN